MPGQTPSQTVGPFFSEALTPAEGGAGAPGWCLAAEDAPGAAICIRGMLLDGAGDPVCDGMVEIWQADAEGRFPDGTGSFPGFGRSATDEAGEFRFRTIKPGPVSPGSAPHVSAAVFARGMLNHAFTRIYFSDESAANARDAVLLAVEPERRETLVAHRDKDGAEPTYRFTIRLQGEDETVFFDA